MMWTNTVLSWIRWRRRLILIVAWLLWSLSLSAPAVNFPNIVFLSPDPIKVRSLVAYAALELAAPLIGAEIAAAAGMVFFLVSPLTLFARAGGRVVSRIGWVMSTGLLLPWGMTFLRGCTTGSLMWGYYLFASAQTLAFVACAVGPPKSPRAGNQRGFSVLPPVRPPPPADPRPLSPPQRGKTRSQRRGEEKGEEKG
jgi:hypothetical protein